MSEVNTSQSLLSGFVFEKPKFEKIDEFFSSLQSDSHFQSFNALQRSSFLNEKLFEFLHAHQSRQFLLLEVLDFIDKVHAFRLLEKYSITDIELWMNQFSTLSKEENYFYRGLISGRYIPRDDYQLLFPIGMGKTYAGSHVITAHQSPDIDTIVSSFWGWIDAFSARVGSGMHIWNVPGGAPASSVEAKILFQNILHPEVFSYLSKNRGQLALTSLDLLTQEGMVKKKRFEHSLGIDSDRNHQAVVLVDDEGYYLGDWRPFDVESIRQVIMLLNLCLRWLETTIHMELLSLFSKNDLSIQEMLDFCDKIKNLSIQQADPIQEMTLRQHGLLEAFLSKVLGISSGLKCTFLEFVQAADVLEIVDFTAVWRHIEALRLSSLFDSKGKLIEDRPLIFYYLDKIVKDLNDLFRAFRSYIDTLDVAFRIKTEVFGYYPQFLAYRTDLKEIENQMGSYPYLTVNVPGPGERQIPVGIIKATDLKKQYLGTATLRDFCNREETKVPPYLEVISVVDHHKSALNTTTAPTAFIADSQSANSLVSQLAFILNDEYSLSGMTEASIDAQIKDLQGKAKTSSDYRVLCRLYKKKEILGKKLAYYVHPVREYLEYLHYLYAILDDTDLLTKVSKRDVVSVASLLNRLKTLMLKKEVEIVHFDDIEPGPLFVQKAADRLLHSVDMYSLYHVTSEAKEKVISENMLKCSRGEPSDIFVDTKEQNGCCRVGQTKIFDKNYALFSQNKTSIRDFWYQSALAVNKNNPEVDLHIHMISTIASADELFKGTLHPYDHKDQMWIWIPETDLAWEHLKLFLNSFKNSPGLQNNELEVEFSGPRAEELASLFKESFLKVPASFSKEKSSVSHAVIYYKPGTLNSRKAMVSPYLPKIGK